MESINRVDLLLKHFYNGTKNEKVINEYKNKKIMVWGAGNIGQHLNDVLQGLEIKITKFLDIDEKKNNTFCQGVEIVLPSDEVFNDEVEIIVANGYSSTIKEQVEERYAKKAYTYVEFLRMLFNVDSKKILEIGPLNNPMFSGKYVKYFDVLSYEGLREKAVSWGLQPEGVPKKIDYISETADLSIIKDKFDCVFSSHVLEHQPDLVAHLLKIENILKVNGQYVLIIPDKRFCLDYFKTESNGVDVLSAYYEKRKVHTLHTLLSGLSTAHNNPKMHWKNQHGYYPKKNLADIEQIVEKYNLSEGRYIDAHAWFFTPESLEEILNELFELGIIKLKIEEIYTTANGELEFFVVLKKVQ